MRAWRAFQGEKRPHTFSAGSRAAVFGRRELLPFCGWELFLWIHTLQSEPMIAPSPHLVCSSESAMRQLSR